MKFITYAIINQQGLIYKGITSDLEKRLNYHNRGRSRWTKRRGPFKLLYSETFQSKTEALKHEKFLKSGKGREMLKKIVRV